MTNKMLQNSEYHRLAFQMFYATAKCDTRYQFWGIPFLLRTLSFKTDFLHLVKFRALFSRLVLRHAMQL